MASKHFLSNVLNAVTALDLCSLLLGSAFMNPAQAMFDPEEEFRRIAIPTTNKEQSMGVLPNPEEGKEYQTASVEENSDLHELSYLHLVFILPLPYAARAGYDKFCI